MLESLEKSAGQLESINKGLNEYLEKKRLFFPRFFFLSNDELLEILAETRDPLRVQPHLKKCFEGITRLTFKNVDGIVDGNAVINMVIESMQSAENEQVDFVREIVPQEAEGLVEKWLQQVENVMRLSLKSEAQAAIEAYLDGMKRNLWISSFPGQIILASNLVFWTNEVTEAINHNNGLEQYFRLSNKRLENLVIMVRGELNKMTRITVEALIVVDVHGNIIYII